MLKLVPIILLLLACSDPDPHGLQATCQIFKDFENGALTLSIDPSERALEMGRLIEPRLKTQEARNIWAAMASVAPEEKYTFMKDALKKLGQSEWSCPEMKNYFKESINP